MLVFTLGCSSEKIYEQNDALTLQKLLYQDLNGFKRISNDQLIVVALKYSKFNRFIVSDSIDLDRNCLIRKVDGEFQSKELISVHLNSFEVCIKGKDSVFIDGSLLGIQQVKSEFSNYYELIHSGNIDVKKDEDSIAYFGEVLIPEILIEIGIDGILNKTSDSTKWNTFYKSLNFLLKTHDELRNEIALEKFGKPFKELNAEKKNVIIIYRPIRLILNFDMKYCSEALFPEDFQYRN